MMLLWVVLAGGAGSGARFLIGQWAAERIGLAFPYGTLIVNLTGCFALGVVVQVASSASWNPELRTAVAVGFLGGFTTYSSFNHDTLALLQSGAVGSALLNVFATLAGGLLAGWLGLAVAHQFAAFGVRP